MEIYALKISDIAGEFSERELEQLMPAFRLEMASKKQVSGKKNSSLAAGALLGFAMKKRGVSFEETPCFNQNGKMYFPPQYRFYVNLSHGGEYAVCALDTKEVGIDIEPVREYREAVLKRICSLEEMEAFFSLLKEEEKNQAFTELWTGKESMVKLSGKSVATLLHPSFCCPEKSPINTKTYASLPGHIISVSSHEKSFPLGITVLSLRSLLR